MTNEKTFRILPVILLLFAAAVAACSGAPGKIEKPLPPVDDDLAMVAPAGEQQVVWLRLEPLRSSPLWGLSDMVAADKRMSDFEQRTGIDPMVAVDEVLVMGTGARKADEVKDRFLILLKGWDNAQAIVPVLSEKAGEDLGEPLERSTPEHVFWEDGAVAALTKRTIAVGSPELVEKAIELAERRGRSLRDDPSFEDFGLEAGDAAALRYLQGEGSPDLSKMKGPIAGWRWADSVNRVDGRARIGATIEARVEAAFDDPAKAKLAARDIGKTLKQVRRNLIFKLFGLGRFLEGFEAQALESSLVLKVTWDERDVEALKSLVAKIQKFVLALQPAEPPPQEDPDAPGPIRLKPHPGMIGPPPAEEHEKEEEE